MATHDKAPLVEVAGAVIDEKWLRWAAAGVAETLVEIDAIKKRQARARDLANNIQRSTL